uniref:Uncharacterized protein LOC100180322 n=1 Tax=Phallusia mammillata TaxID=59560 RepID=A0A6F9DHV5_9ASCI|nr:uncharacterized protein LOC100180322 [Phallusia mammillata]
MNGRDNGIAVYHTTSENLISKVFGQVLPNDPEITFDLFPRPIAGPRLGEEVINEFYKIEDMHFDRGEEMKVIQQDNAINKHTNGLALIGEAGIGKTQMVKTVIKKIVNRQFLPKSKCVFFLKMNEIDFTQKDAFTKFILTFSPIVPMRRDMKPHDLEELKQGEGCVVVIDGLDAANTDSFKRINDDVPTSFNDTTPDVHVKNLLMGRVFPAATKILTCRRREFFELAPRYRLPFILTCRGLSYNLGYTAICKLAKSTQREMRFVMTFFEDRPEIRRICQIPFLCMATVRLLKHDMRNTTNNKNGESIFLPTIDSGIT